MEERRDPYNNKDCWEKWKEKNKKKIKGISEHNSKLMLQFLNDMEQGINISPKTVKGPRTPTTLINLKDHISFFALKIKKDLDKLTKEQIHEFDKKIREGKIKKRNGKEFRAFGNYIKDFKNFYGWLLRTGKVKQDITIDLSKKTNKPKWVYLNEDKFKKLANRCNPDYKALTWFMYDAGLRVTEAYSIKIKNFSKDFTKLAIPSEAAKTFPRTINLKLCTRLIKEFVDHHKLGPNDFLFNKKPFTFNKYLRTLSKKLFGTGESEAGETYDKFTLYDIRHNASCYWLKRYQNMRGLKYRMGWRREEQANYYHEFLGLSDEIQDEDMILIEDRNKYEKEIEELKKENKEVRETLAELDGLTVQSISNFDVLDKRYKFLQKKIKELEKNS